MSSEADKAKQAHQEDVNARRKEQVSKLIDYDKSWDSIDLCIILGVREVSTFS